MEAEQTMRLRAQMTCQSCANAITRILTKVEGVTNVACDIPGQLVTIQAAPSVSPQLLLSKLQTWAEASNKQVALA